jgi:hypothetical protein
MYSCKMASPFISDDSTTRRKMRPTSDSLTDLIRRRASKDVGFCHKKIKLKFNFIQN